MTRFPKEMTENGIHYTLHGDYYFPDLDLPDSPRQTIGRYGRMRKAYLEEHRPGLYERLLLSGKLYDHLAETDRACQDRMERIITGCMVRGSSAIRLILSGARSMPRTGWCTGRWLI